MTVDMLNTISMGLAVAAVCFFMLSCFSFLHFRLKKTFRFVFVRPQTKTKRNVEKSVQEDVTTQLLTTDTVRLSDKTVPIENELEILQDISCL